MRAFRRRKNTVRTSRFESFEPRIVMSAAAPSGLFLDYYVDYVQPGREPLSAAAPDLAGLAQAQSAYGLTGAGQTVVVIDSGIAWRHAALGGGLGAGYRVVGGYDFAERDDNPYDDGPFGSHGTHVAGILASGDSQYAGLAPGVDLVALRVFNDAGQGQFSWVEEALAWVHDHRNSFVNPITTVNLSIGSAWNSSNPPAWAELENELAQLKADGIFVAVAAGNSFTSYNQPGLSYPAASQYVVPVSSVDANGLLSYYSQRHNRAIAAPGRGIVSTVPDYLGNGNGIDDDFAAFSGTSMAAPYVAAASVLLRQAYQIAGFPTVNQDTLYNLMRSTADTIYDGVTGQNYLRLNFQRALDSIAPQDDFGSDPASAHNLGTVVDTLSVSGTIGRADDWDFFRFTAGASGTITVGLDPQGQVQPGWQVDAAASNVAQSGKAVSFDAVAGQSYTVGLGTLGGVGRYTIDVKLDPAKADSGGSPGGQKELGDNTITAAGQWFTLSAVNTGFFTVEALFNSAAGDVDLELFDAGGAWLSGSYGTTGYERIDVSVRAGQTLTLYAWLNGAGANGDVDLRITNLVQQAGSSVVVLGTEADDAFQFRAGPVLQVSINGVEYRLDGRTVQSVEFRGYGGNDTAVLEGTTGRDVARILPGSASLRGASYQAEVAGAESIIVRGSYEDSATLVDSAGDDVFRADPRAATLSGAGFTSRAEGFGVVRAVASEGGSDTAYLYDSAGNDTFIARPNLGVLYGVGFANYAQKFESVYAQASSGLDAAHLHDSNGNDTFIATPQYARLSGDGFSNTAANFDVANGYSVTGGSDRAVLYGSAGNDAFFSGPVWSTLSGDGFNNRAKYFEDVRTEAGAGVDAARLLDSAGDDVLAIDAAQLSLMDQQRAVWAYGFELATARANRGGSNTAEVSAVDLVLELLGDWQET
ncbi:MAG: S8 family serine peptidase [Pirellulales bacterium]|nr:S8 family serine peptidase [Pirellulales bacterium]